MTVEELIDLLLVEDPNARVTVRSNSEGMYLGDVVDVDNDGDVILFTE